MNEKYISFYRDRKDNFIEVETFIKNHQHINYCKAIINKEGKITYVNPSHLYTLERMTGIESEVLYRDMISIYDHPLKWLVEYTKAIPVWSKGFMLSNNPSKESLEALKKLIEAGLVENTIF